MAYNISRWETKELKDFRIPWAFFDARKQVHSECHVRTGLNADLETTVRVADGSMSKGFELLGLLDIDDWIKVTGISNYGIWSGQTWDYDFWEMLAQSKGRLVAVQIWETGDSITRLTVEDGNVTEEQVEV